MGDRPGLDDMHPASGPASTGHGEPPPPPPLEERRILFLDAYDSFTNNIVSLLKDALGANVKVHVLHMDLRTLDADPAPPWTPQQLLARLPAFDAVVCGPGPGSPLRDADVGAFNLLWDLPRDRSVPVLGICLGFQSLVARFGARIRRLRRGLHGMVRDIDHVRSPPADIFDGVPPFRATLYHSLCADVGQDHISREAWDVVRWAPPPDAPELLPLAWTLEPGPGGDERILMAARHATRPFWGVQYHPESVCTDAAAHSVIKNWFHQALKWNEATRRHVDRTVKVADSLSPHGRSLPGLDPRADLHECRWWRDMQTGLARDCVSPRYVCKRLLLPDGVDTADVAEALGLGGPDSIILDSSSTANGDPLARNSILALGVDTALRLEYRVGDANVTLRRPATASRVETRQEIRLSDGPGHDPWTPWHVISEFWRQRKTPGADADADGAVFKGGFMGFVTYEMGLSTLSPGLMAAERGHKRPDICMAWVSRSVVLDHQAGLAYMQALAGNGDDDEDDDEAWIDQVARVLQESEAWRRPHSTRVGSPAEATRQPMEALLDEVRGGGGSGDDRLQFSIPDSVRYGIDVSACQDAIRDGESYELCLTAQTVMTRPCGDDTPQHLRRRDGDNGGMGDGQGVASSVKGGVAARHGTPWHLFRTLRSRQPAPFGSFIRLGGATLISSSPERFLTHDRHGLCSMRPMKGTVRKSDAVRTLAQAEAILHVPKEEAENLMIVDLVRHDLHGACGAGSVSVPDLLRVEEYAAVFQMITAVNGQLPAARLAGGFPRTGLDVLAASLPPGSMTGAPKKRSCEILRRIEPRERSVYAGVVGYLGVDGQGDWSVTIRTMFRWDDEQTAAEPGAGAREVWRIGAGGAVTTLSTPEGETDEMLTKLCGPLGVFRDAA